MYRDSRIQVEARLEAMDGLLDAAAPALAAALLPRLARDAAVAWPLSSGAHCILQPTLSGL